MLSLIKNKNKKIQTQTKKSNLNTFTEYLVISYPDTLLQSIKNNQDITNIPNVSSIYQNAPKITIQNAKSKLYLITMTDPDAPYGISNTTKNKTIKNISSKNHIYTHWIYLQDMRKKPKNTRNTKNTSNTTNNQTILVPYGPPSPPYGIHRYQFKLYDATNVSQTILGTLKNNINNINTTKLKLICQIQYKVNSGKSNSTSSKTSPNPIPI